MTTLREFNGNRMIFHITGELDESNVTNVRESFDFGLSQNPDSVVLNLSRLDFIDSSGLGMIISRYKKMRRMGIPLYLYGLKQQTQKVFKTAGLLEIIRVLG